MNEADGLPPPAFFVMDRRGENLLDAAFSEW
jgi:hypothetical protein